MTNNRRFRRGQGGTKRTRTATAVEAEDRWPESWHAEDLLSVPHCTITWTTYEDPVPARFGLGLAKLVRVKAEHVDGDGRRRPLAEGEIRRFRRFGSWMLAVRRARSVAPTMRVCGIRNLRKAKSIALEFIHDQRPAAGEERCRRPGTDGEPAAPR